MSAEVIWEQRGVICKCIGTITRGEIMKAGFKGFYDDERNMHINYQIFDAYEANELRLSQNDILLLASTAIGRSRLVPNIRAAIIAPNPQVKALIEQYVAYFERVKHTWEFRYFDEPQFAYTWARQNPRATLHSEVVV